MKKCPFCAEEIQDEAIKCRFCGEFIVKAPPKPKWYYRNSSLVIAFLCLGPFVLPLVWLNPSYGVKKKIIYSVIIIVISYYVIVMLGRSVKAIFSYYSMLNSIQ